MIQTQWVCQQLHRQWPNLDVVIEQIHTTGDRVTNVPLTKIGRDGVFVTEIEQALQKRRIDLAVHSLKDLPTAQPEGVRLVVVGPREDARDVFISNAAFQVVEGRLTPVANSGHLVRALRIGTCSLRRTAQIRAQYPDADVLPLRGNVDTRLRKLEMGDYDGIILAAAGLHRMDLPTHLAERLIYFPIDLMMPAPGQGALAVEIRDDPELYDLLAPLDDRAAQAATTAERMFMRRLGAGCYLPVAAYGEITDGMLSLRGLVISLDGQQQVRVQQSIPWTMGKSIEDAKALGISAAEQALLQGADVIIREIGGSREQEQQRA
jgi:hydroxymethylbilane synthase